MWKYHPVKSKRRTKNPNLRRVFRATCVQPQPGWARGEGSGRLRKAGRREGRRAGLRCCWQTSPRWQPGHRPQMRKRQKMCTRFSAKQNKAQRNRVRWKLTPFKIKQNVKRSRLGYSLSDHQDGPWRQQRETSPSRACSLKSDDGGVGGGQIGRSGLIQSLMISNSPELQN